MLINDIHSLLQRFVAMDTVNKKWLLPTCAALAAAISFASCVSRLTGHCRDETRGLAPGREGTFE